jgi:hypothetical protein
MAALHLYCATFNDAPDIKAQKTAITQIDLIRSFSDLDVRYTNLHSLPPHCPIHAATPMHPYTTINALLGIPRRIL